MVERLDSDRVFLIDANDYYGYFTTDMITDNIYMSHFTAIGYSNIAGIVSIMISECMNKNADLFRDLAFIPYGNNDIIN